MPLVAPNLTQFRTTSPLSQIPIALPAPKQLSSASFSLHSAAGSTKLLPRPPPSWQAVIQDGYSRQTQFAAGGQTSRLAAAVADASWVGKQTKHSNWISFFLF